MANPILERIERAERELPKIEKEKADLVRAAEEDDGEVTAADEEYEEIKTLTTQIAALERIVREQRKIFEENKAKWEGMSSDRSAVLGQINEVIAWGDTAINDIKSVYDDAHNAAADDCYAEATDTFADVETSLKPIYDEYLKQAAAKEKYDALLDQINQRLDVLAQVGVQSQDAETSLGQIETNLISANYPTESLDYEEAHRLLQMNDAEMSRYEAEITRLQDEQVKADAALADFQSRLAQVEADVAGFEELHARIKVVRGMEPDILTAMGSWEFVAAQQMIASNEAEMDIIESELVRVSAEYDAEQERIKAEFEQWQRREARWHGFQTDVAELSDWSAPEAESLFALGDEIQGYITAEEYLRACDAFDPAETQLDKAWPTHLKQKEAQKTYDSDVPPLRQRLTDARTSTALTEDLENQLASIEMTLENMQISADVSDYVSAVDAIEDVTKRLDAAEQGIRDAETRAQVESEMGLGPGMSDPAVENEINKRLYEAEYPALETRISDADRAISSDPLGFKVQGALDQLQTDLDSINGMVAMGDYAGALEGVRAGVTSMNTLDEMVRDQLARKGQFEEGQYRMSEDIFRLTNSELSSVAEDAADLSQRAGGIMQTSGVGEYENALQVLSSMDAEVQALQDRADAETRLKAEVMPEWTALKPRYEAAKANQSPEVDAARTAVERSGAIVSNAIDVEDYTTASGEIGNLRTLLDEFEPEAERAQAYQRYQDTLATFPELDADMIDMRSNTYPEADEEMQACEDAEADRLSHEKAGDWAAARNAIYVQNSKIGLYKAKAKEIDAARDNYQNNVAATTLRSEQLFPKDAEDPTGGLERLQAELSETKRRMETAAGLDRWIDAYALLGDFGAAVKDGEITVRDLLQASDGDINGLISIHMKIASGIVINAINYAILDFKIDVKAEIAKSRSFQDITKGAGYVLDIGAAGAGLAGAGGAVVMGLGPVGWAGVALGFAVVKIAAEVIADRADAAMDKEAEEILERLTKDLQDAAKKAASTFNKEQGEFFKKHDPDLYRTIGNHLYNNNRAAAIKALEGSGVPVAATQITLQQQYRKQLTDQSNLGV